MMLTMQGGVLSAERGRRSIPLQHVTEADRYRALRLFGVRPEVAAAVAAGLITVNLKTA